MGSGAAPLAITGTVPGQPTTSETPVRPFATTVISDPNADATDTLTIAISGGGGTLSDGSGYAALAIDSSGNYTFSGSATAVTSELQALVFTPTTGAPNTQATTTFALTDSSTALSNSFAAAPTVVASFTGADGAAPYGSLFSDAVGNLFGTTASGGANNAGTVFELAYNGSGYAAPMTLASFAGADGSGPAGSLIADAAGDLFGTTASGGAEGDGTVFELVNGASGYGAPVTLASFTGANGSEPDGSLIMDASGNLFGTTNAGGASNDGTVFEMVKGASGYGAPVVLASFTGANGANPSASLVADAAGDLFGTTEAGGANGDGTVFELAKTASGYAAPVVLANFAGANGANPYGSLITDVLGNLYGTTSAGGANGDGTVFELVKDGSGYDAPVTLASFNGANGANPYGDLIADASGNLFGTTGAGGANGYGTVFELVKGTFSYGAPVTLASFTATNGAYPYNSLITDASGNLFATTVQGGTANDGTVFELSRAPIAAVTATASVVNADPGPPQAISGTVSGQTTTFEAVVKPFATTVISDTGNGATEKLTITMTGAGGTLSDGAGFSGLLRNADGSYALSGSAAAVTSELQALAFKPTAGAAGAQLTTNFTLSDSSTPQVAPYNNAPTVLGSFNGTDSANPYGNLTADAAGNLFGMTNAGGSASYGTVFEMVKGASGYAAPVTLASFTGDNGADPYGSLIMDAAGDLFGTTSAGGSGSDGTVFELVKGASGYAAPVTLGSFTGANGVNPLGSLLADAAGNLFGTTEAGGTNGDGTVFEVVKTASGYDAPVTIASFDGTDGASLYGSLIADAAGDLFGTTAQGGANGYGTVFELVKGVSGFGAPVTLASFTGDNGAYPYGSLTIDAAGDLFGTTGTGGVSGYGTVFELVKGASGYGAPVTLTTFTGANGAYPYNSLITDAAGDLYGTTVEGGANGYGAVFELTRAQIAAVTASASVINYDSRLFRGATGGFVANFTPGIVNTAYLSGTAGNWDTVNGSGGVVYLNGAQASVSGGNDTINVSGTGDQLSLYATNNNWDTVNGSGASVVFNGAQASVFGGGDTLWLNGTSNAVSLYNTAGNWDTVNATGASVVFTGVQASVFGGGDVLWFNGTSNAVSLYSTAGNWDTVNAANTSVVFNGVQASVFGGGDTLWFNGAGNSVSLYNTGGTWDTVNADNTAVVFNGVQASVFGGGDVLWLNGTSNSISLYNTGGNWDTVNGSNATVVLNSVQTSVNGGGDTLWFNGTGNSVSLYGTGGNWDTINAVNTGVVLNSSQASVTGGGDTLWLYGSGDQVSLYATGASADTVNGANAIMTLNGVAASVAGDGNQITLNGTNTLALSGNSEQIFTAKALGSDTITGFNATDHMQFAASAFADWAHLLGATKQQGSDTVITLDAGDQITLKGVLAASLSSGQFAFK